MHVIDEDGNVLEHYGVKGMRWGIRKYRSKGSKAGEIVKRAVVGDPKTTITTAYGRKGLKKKLGQDVATLKRIGSKVTSNKIFKAVIYDKDLTILTKKGREGRAKLFKKQAEERYKKALAKEKSQKAAKKERAKATRELIERLIKEDKETAAFFGKKTDEAADRAYWEKLFASDLKED